MSNVIKPRTHMFKNYILVLLLLNLCACATTHSVPVPPFGFVPSGIAIGDNVEVVTIHNDTHTFEVTKINAVGIGGSTEFFAYVDIKSMKVRQASDAWGATVLPVMFFVVEGIFTALTSVQVMP